MVLSNIIPLSKPDIEDSDIDCAVNIIKSGFLVQGKAVKSLESDVSQYLNIQNCSAVSSGTASLHLALLALGIGHGDEVIIPAFSFVATANVVELTGATPVFVDIHPESFNIDETLIEGAISNKTKAIMPVHEFGLCANMPAIMEIARRNSLAVIEDAACALGAKFKSKYAGSFGHFGSFSLHPRKAVTSGEGGLLVSSSPELDYKIKVLRNHGIEPDSNTMNFIDAGFNYRMTDFQAALVSGQFSRIEKIIEYRTSLATFYLDKIHNRSITLPHVPPNVRHAWQSFHILLESEDIRNRLMEYLKSLGIMTNYGAQCIPHLSYYKNKYNHHAEVEFPNAFRSYTSGLAIPIYNKMTMDDVLRVADAINKFN